MIKIFTTCLLFLFSYKSYSQNTEIIIEKEKVEDSIFYTIRNTSVASINVTIRGKDTLATNVIFKKAFNVPSKGKMKDFVKTHIDIINSIEIFSEILDIEAYYGNVKNADNNDNYIPIAL